MYIVYEEDEIDKLRSKYLLLEMDTIKISEEKTITAHCVIDTQAVNLQEIASLGAHESMHKELIKRYKQQDWNFCIEAITVLKGCFKGEVDSYYDNILERIEGFKNSVLAPDWNGVLNKTGSKQ